MAIRIPWDEFEAAYLLFELVRVLEGKTSRKEAVKIISNTLRSRAVRHGLEIDPEFRNTNGIKLQMYIMEYILTDGAHGLWKESTPDVFRHVVFLYKSDRDKFDELVKEAFVVPTTQSAEESFYAWLSTQVSPSALSDLYTCYREISDFCVARKILRNPLLETSDPYILNNVLRTIESNKVFRFAYKRQLKTMSLGMRKYIEYRKEHAASFTNNTLARCTPDVCGDSKNSSINHAVPADRLIQFLSERGIKYIDRRNENGYFWMIGGSHLSSVADECKHYGVIFHFSPDGESATFGQPAWWTKDSFKECTSLTTLTDSAEIIDGDQDTGKTTVLDLNQRFNLAFTKPIVFHYFGEEHPTLGSWKHLYIEVLKCLLDDYPSILQSYKNKSLSGQGRCDFVDATHKGMLLSPKAITDDYFVETNLSATDIVLKIKRLLDICSVDYENLVIQYTAKIPAICENEAPKSPQTTFSRQSVLDNSKEAENRKAFIGWMQKNGIANATILGYLSAIGQCTKHAKQFELTDKDLFEIKNANELLLIRDRLFSISSFVELNERQHNRFLSALNKMISFRRDTESHQNTRKGIAPLSNISNDSSCEISFEIKERYEYILSNHFSEDGYQLGRAIFRGRFKRYYTDEYGVEPSETDENIEVILRNVGTVRDGRIFPKRDGQAALVNEIVNNICFAFNAGASGVYIEAVFDKFQSRLADELQIYNAEALSPILLTSSNGRFAQRHTYFVQRPENADPSRDLLRIMQSFHEPQNYTTIHEKAWYIPFDKMKALLVWDKSIVNVAPETYFYAPNLPVSSSEVAQLISVIQTELEYKTHITDIELLNLIQTKCPSIAINTDGFTTYGLRNCLGYILRDQFSFNGPIISRLGKELSMSDVYAEFARNHDELYFEDLKRLSVEMNIGIYWDSILEEMVRVSPQKLVRRDLIYFDVALIDEVLDKMCPNEYIPIRDVNLFLQFPNIGYAWNHYVLESYLFKNSRKFRLLHGSFGQNSVCGAMVRTESTISDYRTLLVDVLSKSNALNSTGAALQYIVEHGYQQRRRYDGIEQLIKEAKLIKDRREAEEK